MKIPEHAALAGLTSPLLIPVLGPGCAAFWASSVLIDADHYCDYVYRNGFRDFSLKRALEFNRILNEKAEGRPFIALHMFHTIEFWGLLAGIAIVSGNSWVFAVLWGVLLHIVLDFVYVYSRGILFWRAFSVVEYFIRWNLMKRKGKHPDLTYRYALKALYGDET